MRFFESFFIHYKGIHLGDTVRKLYLLQHCYFFANWCCQGHFREHFRTFFWWVDISIRKEPRARQKCKGENTTWNGSISRAKKMLCKVVLSRLSWLVLLVYHLAASAETYFCCKENSKRHLALLDNGEKRAINSDTLTKKRKLEIYVLFVVTILLAYCENCDSTYLVSSFQCVQFFPFFHFFHFVYLSVFVIFVILFHFFNFFQCCLTLQFCSLWAIFPMFSTDHCLAGWIERFNLFLLEWDILYRFQPVCISIKSLSVVITTNNMVLLTIALFVSECSTLTPENTVINQDLAWLVRCLYPRRRSSFAFFVSLHILFPDFSVLCTPLLSSSGAPIHYIYWQAYFMRPSSNWYIYNESMKNDE